MCGNSCSRCCKCRGEEMDSPKNRVTTQIKGARKEERLASDIGSFNRWHRDASFWFTVLEKYCWDAFQPLNFDWSNFNSSVWLRSSYEPIVCYFSPFVSLLLRFLRVCAICGSNCVLLKAAAVQRSKTINLLLQYECNTSVPTCFIFKIKGIYNCPQM